MKELTKAEEEVMQVLWKLGQGFANDIVTHLQESVEEGKKPAYNTILTVVRILEKKGFVAHETFGKSNRYYPLVKKEEYSQSFLHGFVKNYFDNSFQSLFSCFANKENLSIQELEALKKMIEKELKKND